MNPLVISENIIPSAVIILTLVFYYVYYYFVNSGLIEKYFTTKIWVAQKEIAVFLLKKVSGFIILGLIPGILYYFLLNRDFEIFGLTTEGFNKNFFVIFLLILVITITLYFNQKVNKTNNTLQIKLQEWNILQFLLNSVGWIIYLTGYEFLFRGILLFECYNSFGFWPAMAINVAIYSAIHMVNGKKQAIGSLTFGFIAAYLTISQGTLLIPVIMHVSLSIVSDYFSIRYNVSLNFSKQSGLNLPSK